MVIDNQVMQLACAILPGLMLRIKEPGYTDSSAIYEAFNLAHDCLSELRKTSETGAELTPNTAIMQCCLHTEIGAQCDVLGFDFRCGVEPCRLALHNCQ